MATTEMVVESRHLTANGPVAEMKAIALRRLQMLDAEVHKTKALLEYLTTMDSAPHTADESQLPPIVPGIYKGKKLSPAFDDYLRARRGIRIPLKRAFEDLELSGADMGKRKFANLKIVIGSRKNFVEFDEASQTLWLAESALLPPKKRIRKKG